MVVGVDVDDVGAEGPDFAVQGDRSLASSVVAPCWMWLRSATTMRLSSSNWAAAMRASQFEPSWSGHLGADRVAVEAGVGLDEGVQLGRPQQASRGEGGVQGVGGVPLGTG